MHLFKHDELKPMGENERLMHRVTIRVRWQRGQDVLSLNCSKKNRAEILEKSFYWQTYYNTRLPRGESTGTGSPPLEALKASWTARFNCSRSCFYPRGRAGWFVIALSRLFFFSWIILIFVYFGSDSYSKDEEGEYSFWFLPLYAQEDYWVVKPRVSTS